MQTDHIFIFTSKPDEAGQELIDFGLNEGSSRVHKGQGTANRKFYFRNFFIELLFVNVENEIKSKATAPTKLWERSQFEKNNWSPFGLILVNDTSTDKLFSESIEYQPTYFPEGMWIDVITNETEPQLPSIFRLPYRDKIPDNSNEPIHHKSEIKLFTKAMFQIPNPNHESTILKYFSKEERIQFSNDEKYHLTLEFDESRQSKSYQFKTLPLTINY